MFDLLMGRLLRFEEIEVGSLDSMRRNIHFAGSSSIGCFYRVDSECTLTIPSYLTVTVRDSKINRELNACRLSDDTWEDLSVGHVSLDKLSKLREFKDWREALDLRYCWGAIPDLEVNLSEPLLYFRPRGKPIAVVGAKQVYSKESMLA